MEMRDHYGVVILGGGLAGLSLARHLLLDSDKTLLILEKRAEVPPARQKVGESSVQLAGYYFSKVLDLEEYLWRNQFMKYNLRFYWTSSGRDNSRFEDYSQAYIRRFSNIASYQLDRNTFEGELLRRNLEEERFEFAAPVPALEVNLSDEGPHEVRFTHDGTEHRVTADWVIDTTGRNRYLARKMDMMQQSTIRHGTFFWWVDGLVDIEKLTDRSRKEIRLKRDRTALGHLPIWLATNHFMKEGLWFWVIPLQGKTSLGLVYDSNVVSHDEVSSVEKATKWVCREFPLFARDLPARKVLDSGSYRRFSHDCVRTISPSRWAVTGEAGRFSDPLYSPGSDLIAVYNTLIVDAVKTSDRAELQAKCELYEQLMRAIFSAYVPTYATSYDALGDAEAFSLKYTWELTVYFGGYVFPFINDLFTDRRFVLGFLRLFSRLGPINNAVQQFLSDYFQWKKTARRPADGPVFFDFTEIESLNAAEATFYDIGVSVEEAKKIFARQVANLEELGRFIATHIASVVLDDKRVLTNRAYIEGIDLAGLTFDPEQMRERFAGCVGCQETYDWSLDPFAVARRFRMESTEQHGDASGEHRDEPAAGGLVR